MVLMKSMYRLSIRYSMFICFLIIAFGMGFSLIFFLGDDQDALYSLDQYDNKIVFWSNDYHISPIRDLKELLTPLGVQFIDKSLSGACAMTDTCAEDLHVLTPNNAMSPQQATRNQFYQYYKNHSLMKRVDAYVCFHPAAMCELFMPFNRTIIVIASTRYELGRFSAKEWNEWNQNLRLIASDPRNIVAGNNLYDAEYIRYFTGINTIVLPSLCAYTNTIYQPSHTHPEYIFIPSRQEVRFNQQFLSELNLAINKLNKSIVVKPLRELYEFYSYSDIARHPAVIYLPYQASTMSIFEQYTMNIPLFFPSLDLLTEWHLKYKVVYDRTWDNVRHQVSTNRSIIQGHPSSSAIPDPNNEHDYASVHYWLKFADFYQWPYITYFNSIDDLALKLKTTNLASISKKMSVYNRQKRVELRRRWKQILYGISTSSNFLQKKISL